MIRDIYNNIFLTQIDEYWWLKGAKSNGLHDYCLLDVVGGANYRVEEWLCTAWMF